KKNNLPTPLYNVGELINVGFDVQDLFVQVTIVIHLKSTLPHQIHDQRRRPFTVLRRGVSGWAARSFLSKGYCSSHRGKATQGSGGGAGDHSHVGVRKKSARRGPGSHRANDGSFCVRMTGRLARVATGSQHSAVAACKGGWVAIDLRSTVGLASLPRSGRGRPSPGMLAKACSIASAASRSSRSPRKRPVTCRPKGIACSSIPPGMEIAGLVTSVTT